MGSFNKLKTILEEKEHFVLLCHIEPDGDAIGSILALKEILEREGKKVVAVSRDPIPPVLRFLPNQDKIIRNLPENEFDTLILLDNGDSNRTGFAKEIKTLREKGVVVVNIDHHLKNDLWRMVSINHANENVSSTCELLYNIFIGLNYHITADAATALLTGIFFDTGGFHHSNTSPEVLDIVAELLKKGAKLKKISENIENSRPISLFKLWGVALSRLTLNERYGLSISVITKDDLEKAGASEDDISGLINLLNSAPESRAALLLYESGNDKIKGSLRTEKDDVDVSRVAQLFGGGGHRKAAGFTISGRIELNGAEWKIV